MKICGTVARLAFQDTTAQAEVVIAQLAQLVKTVPLQLETHRAVQQAHTAMKLILDVQHVQKVITAPRLTLQTVPFAHLVRVALIKPTSQMIVELENSVHKDQLGVLIVLMATTTMKLLLKLAQNAQLVVHAQILNLHLRLVTLEHSVLRELPAVQPVKVENTVQVEPAFVQYAQLVATAQFQL